jgi:hypothetical protein|tara:strand:- start:912 stop:1109 length:198 start_codon:yes stop_codon:yes gene_type:complete
MIPPPILTLTMEQQLKLRVLEDAVKSSPREDVELLTHSLQKQVFMLQNTLSNLVKTGTWNEVDGA